MTKIHAVLYENIHLHTIMSSQYLPPDVSHYAFNAILSYNDFSPIYCVPAAHFQTLMCCPSIDRFMANCRLPFVPPRILISTYKHVESSCTLLHTSALLTREFLALYVSQQ